VVLPASTGHLRNDDVYHSRALVSKLINGVWEYMWIVQQCSDDEFSNRSDFWSQYVQGSGVTGE